MPAASDAIRCHGRRSMPTRRAVLAALPALALPALALAPRPARADTPPVYAEGAS